MALQYCESCKSEHLGPVPCGLTFRERVATTQVHGSVLESRTAKDRYDEDAVEAQFGMTRTERREEFTADTRGLGTLKPVDGGYLHKNRKTGNVERISDEKVEREFSTPR